MKTCFKCHQQKPFSDFYKHKEMADGYLNKCKECAKKDALAHRDKNIDQIREKDRLRGKSEKRIARNAENVKRYRERNAKRYKANNKLNNALRDGKIQKLPCFICGVENTEGHHPDYDRPLDVVWLCAEHHKEIHLKQPR